MYALVYLTKHIDSITLEEFFRHYHDVHYGLALKLPGLVSYTQTRIRRDGFLGDLAIGEYDALSQYVFESSDAAAAAFSSPEGVALNEDTGLFMDWPSVVTIPVEIVRPHPGDTTK